MPAVSPTTADPPAAGRARPIRFDSVAFDPLVDGEPDLSSFAPETPALADEPAGTPRLALVQFDGAPGPRERADLLALGVQPLFYVPEGAYLVRADDLALSRAAGLSGVRWAGRYRPGYKIDRRLAGLLAGWPGASPLPGEGAEGQALDLLLAPGARPADVAARIAAIAPGVEVLAESDGSDPGLLVVLVPHGTLRLGLTAAVNLEDVLAVEPHGRVELHNDDAVWIGQSYDTVNRQNYAKTATVWNRGLLGDGEVIAIADSGVDPDVCWLIDTAGLPAVSNVPATGVGRGPIPTDPSRRKIIAYNLLGTLQAPATPYDVRSGDPHGTWCAVSALGNNPDFTTTEDNPTARHHDPADGVAPLAKLVVEDLGDDAGRLVGLGLPLPTIIDQLFEQERTAGARISTNSWGVEGNQYDTLAFFADRMVFNNPDFVLVFSAGNSGPYPGSLASPGTAKNVITVGASDAKIVSASGLNPENVADFSARGPTVDGRTKPDLVISGKQLVTGTSDRAEVGRTCATATVNGTSFAAPVAAGFAALAREYYRKGYYPTGTRRAADGFLPSAALVKATLVAGARNMTGKGGANWSPCVLDTCDLGVGLCNSSLAPCRQDQDCYYCSGNGSMSCTTNRDCDLSMLQDDAPSNDQGWGRLHLDDALFFPADQRGLAVWDVPRSTGLATGEVWSTQVYLDGRAEDLKIVLTWPDPPALVASPTYLVNDLDLKVTAPNGTVYWGNAFATRNRDPLLVEYTTAGVRPQNDVETVEMVRIASYLAPAGVWTIEVVGESVPGSPWIDGGARQDFAVVAAGPIATSGGIVRFTRPRWSCSGTVGIEVLDQNAAASLSVAVATGSGDTETVALAAQGGGRFSGTIAAVSGSGLVPGNGRLELADGETLRATYVDAAPSHTSVAVATIECGGDLLAGVPQVSGGCDADGFLDAGEIVSVEVPLSNPGPLEVHQASARLVVEDPTGEVYVADAEANYGDIPIGGAATNVTPFRISARPSVAPRSTRTAYLELRAEGWSAPRRIPLSLVVEADETHTNGSWSENFSTIAGVCHDGSTAAPTDRWYWFDVNENCATSEQTWMLGNCFGSRQALLPGCSGQLLGSANERHHRLVSPQITTGSAGSTTLLKRVSFKETYHFKLNLDGKPCDRVEVQVFANRDGRLLPTGYYRDRNGDGTDQVSSVDPTTVADWTLPPLPDATLVQLLFHTALHSPLDGATCSSGTGVEARWRVDDVLLEYENISVVDDAGGPCTPACTVPGAPGGLTVTAQGGALLVGWDPVPGAHHYVVRRDGVVAGIATAPDVALVDRPTGGGPYAYSVEAVDDSGLCFSPESATATWQGALGCSAAPPAPANLLASDGSAATCRADLTWSAVTAPCGGPVTYRVYRSTDPDFVPGPEHVLAETTATAWSDLALTTGWDANGEPSGDEWTYEVRAIDGATGLEGSGSRAAVRPGGPAQSGTWIDDGGDARPAKLVPLTLADDNGTGGSWSRSPVAVHHGGNWSWWPDADPFGTGDYPALSCLSLVSPPIRLDTAGSPELRFWLNYQIEHKWDGLVVELSAGGGPFAPIAPISGYPGTFANTVAPPCAGDGSGAGPWINGCDYPPTQGCITGPASGAASGWREFRFNLAAWSGQTVSFRLNLSTDCGTTGGAVLDDTRVTAALLGSPCSAGSCWPAPLFSGLLAAADLDPLLPSGIGLSWGNVESWGGGGTGQFEVWRDGTRIAILPPTARSLVDTTALLNAPHTYVVTARSACGLPSDTRARFTAQDCGALDPATRDAAHLDVVRADATIVLRADPIPGAGRYRFRWSTDPSSAATSPDGALATAPETRHDALSNGQSYFYLVEDAAPADCP